MASGVARRAMPKCALGFIKVCCLHNMLRVQRLMICCNGSVRRIHTDNTSRGWSHGEFNVSRVDHASDMASSGREISKFRPQWVRPGMSRNDMGLEKAGSATYTDWAPSWWWALAETLGVLCFVDLVVIKNQTIRVATMNGFVF